MTKEENSVQKLLRTLASVIEEHVPGDQDCKSTHGTTKASVLVGATRHVADNFDSVNSAEPSEIEKCIVNLTEGGAATITLTQDRGKFFTEVSDDWTGWILKIFKGDTLSESIKAASDKKDEADLILSMEPGEAKDDDSTQLDGPEDDELINSPEDDEGSNILPTDAPPIIPEPEEEEVVMGDNSTTPGRKDQSIDLNEDSINLNEDKDVKTIRDGFKFKKKDDLPGRKTFDVEPPEAGNLFENGGGV